MSVSFSCSKVQPCLFACVQFSQFLLVASPPNQFSLPPVILLLTTAAFSDSHTASVRLKVRCNWGKEKHGTKGAFLKHLSHQRSSRATPELLSFHLLPMLGSEQDFCSSLPKLCLAALFRSWRDTTHWWVSTWWTNSWENKSLVLLTRAKCCTEFLGSKVVCHNCC